MTPEELHRDLTNAFNWPVLKLTNYTRGSRGKRKILDLTSLTESEENWT